MYGWAGIILRIDLTSGEVIKEPLDLDFARKYLGGEGLGARILWDEVGPEVEDGLDPGNALIYTSGPLTGTLAPGCGRLEIVTKSPITGIFGDANAGGHFAPEFKRAGYDAIVIKGKAAKPVFLWIDDDQIEIRDASRLWGKTVSETDRQIKADLGDKDIQVSCIGPAGENKVRFATLVNNLAGVPAWGGNGAVAGSKNLKAVAVRGTGGIRIARPEEFEQACREAIEKIKRLSLFHTRRVMGTMYLMRALYLAGVGQIHNYSVANCSPEHLEQICGEKWAKEYPEKNNGCHSCPVQCRHHCVIKEGKYAGLSAEGYEYGALTGYVYSYGSPNLAFAMTAAQYCNDFGLDAAEPAYLMAWATDCFQRGIFNTEDTDGLVLDWANEEVAFELLKKITYRQGFGNVLAEGLARAARAMGRGSEYYAQTIKGRLNQENPVRSSYGWALSGATSTRGADHLKGWPFFEFMSPSPETSLKYWGHAETGDRRSHKGKAPMTVYDQHIFAAIDIVGACKFHTRPPVEGLNEGDYARLVSAATGIDFEAKDLLTIAERVYNLEQAYNVRLGLSRKDDTVPEMYFKEPFNAGPLKGFVLKKENFDQALSDYYELRGWDARTGIPTRETLERLDLKDVADELSKCVTLS